jgi:predicted Fe-Mo cluster-binding NifX family protein
VKVAIPQWNGRVSPVFDAAETVMLYETAQHEIRGQTLLTIKISDHLQRARWLQSLGVDTLICGALSKSLERTLTPTGITVIPFICGKTEEVIEAYIAGQLEKKDYRLPGYTEQEEQ